MKCEDVPFITCVPNDGRRLLLQPHYDGASWSLYFPSGQGEVVKIQMGPDGLSSGLYYALSPARTSDLELPALSTFVQHLSFPRVAHCIYSLADDFQLLAASLEKLEIFRRIRSELPEVRFLVMTELEYLFIQVRAMYDVLHACLIEVCSRLTDPAGNRACLKLPTSFAKVVFAGERLRTSAEIQEKYALPEALARFYTASALRLSVIRGVRVDIEHHGKGMPLIFDMGDGFGIQATGGTAWASMDVWGRHELRPNSIGSVRALAAYLAETSVGLFHELEVALRATIDPARLPRAVASDCRVFLTNPCMHHLRNLSEVISDPWASVMTASERAADGKR